MDDGIAGGVRSVAVRGERLLTRRTLPYFVGGFLGPFGTTIVIPIYPELRDTFGASTEAVTWSFSGYLLPMAALMLVSGTIGERFGRRRVTRATFVAYTVASIGCALAPTLGVFIAARVVQGCCNAFITPLLLAGLMEIMPVERTGRAVGIYSGFQAAGGMASPIVAGGLAVLDWRLAFVVVALVSATLAFRPAPGAARPGAAAPRIRPLLTRRMGALCSGALVGAAGPLGVAVFIGLFLRDELGVGPVTGGAVLAAGSAAAAAASPSWGAVLDRWGARRSATVAFVVAAAIIAPLGLVGSVWVLLLLTMATSAAIGFGIVVVQHLAALAVPDNRGGGASAVLSFRFAGHAIGPLVLVPVFVRSPGATFGVVAALGVVAMVAILWAIAMLPTPAE